MIDHAVALELRRLVFSLIAGFVVGLLIAYPLHSTLAAFCLYLCFHAWVLWRFHRWMKNSRQHDLPDVGGIWGEIFDLHTRRSRREAREKQRLKDIIERINATTTAIEDAIVILDQRNLLSWWNQSAVDLLKFKNTDSGNSVVNFIRVPAFVNYLESEDFENPITISSPFKSHTQLEFRFTRFGQGETLMVVRDVTGLYRLQQMRKDFVANVSHELRTPLTVIRGYLEMFDEGDSNEKLLQKALPQLQQQTQRMTSLIDDLTILSKLETEGLRQNLRYVNVQNLMEVLCDEARVISGDDKHNIILQSEISVELWGSDKELLSAFSNLLTNAVKYSPPEKTIWVKVFLNDSDSLVVSVEDQGLGIDEKHIPRLTERFYRVDSSRSIETGGTGLGLAIVKHILLRHDAELKISSQIGQGSQFSCVFPSERIKVNVETQQAMSN